MNISNPAKFDADTDDVFARIAHKYDRLHDIFSFRIHRMWKSRMAKIIAQQSGTKIFDAGAGTGDIPARFLRFLKDHDPKRVVEITLGDSCPQMLDVARERLGEAVAYQICDVHGLTDISDETYDLYTNAFLMKLCQLPIMADEAFRVLKPGGVFVTLEASQLPFPPLRWFYLNYMSICLPLIARLSGETDQSIWRYFLSGIKNVDPPEHVSATLAAAGFTDISYERLSLGIVAIHVATKPA